MPLLHLLLSARHPLLVWGQLLLLQLQAAVIAVPGQQALGPSCGPGQVAPPRSKTRRQSHCCATCCAGVGDGAAAVALQQGTRHAGKRQHVRHTKHVPLQHRPQAAASLTCAEACRRIGCSAKLMRGEPKAMADDKKPAHLYVWPAATGVLMAAACSILLLLAPAGREPRTNAAHLNRPAQTGQHKQYR